MTRHQDGISALFSQTLFGGETSGNVGSFLRTNRIPQLYQLTFKCINAQPHENTASLKTYFSSQYEESDLMKVCVLPDQTEPESRKKRQNQFTKTFLVLTYLTRSTAQTLQTDEADGSQCHE